MRFWRRYIDDTFCEGSNSNGRHYLQDAVIVWRFYVGAISEKRQNSQSRARFKKWQSHIIEWDEVHSQR